MALRDPVVVYDAADNMEAHLVRNALLSAGVETFVTEDVTLNSELKPHVWVERTDIERAKPIVQEYDRRNAARRYPTQAGLPIDVTCRACGLRTRFSLKHRGSVQECPHCGAYVDVIGDKNRKVVGGE